MSGYAFHPEAFADLDEIWEYIAESNLDAADRVSADIHAVLRTLATSPHIGRPRPDLTTRPLRFHVVRDDYLIAYAPNEIPLWVVAVLHGRRNPRVLAAILRGREEKMHEYWPDFNFSAAPKIERRRRLPGWVLDDPARMAGVVWLMSVAVAAKCWVAAYSWRRLSARHLRQYLLVWGAATTCNPNVQ